MPWRGGFDLRGRLWGFLWARLVAMVSRGAAREGLRPGEDRPVERIRLRGGAWGLHCLAACICGVPRKMVNSAEPRGADRGHWHTGRRE